MSDETENKGYNKPQVGEEDWHVPLNENFDRIDADIYEIEQRIGNGSGDVTGQVIHPAAVYQNDTESPIEGHVVEAFDAGSLDHYVGDVEEFEIVDSELEGEHMLEFEAPDVGGSTTSFGVQSDVIETQRGFQYSAYVRGDPESEDGRSQLGFLVLADYDDDGELTDGYQIRLNVYGDGERNLEVLKWQGGDFITGEDTDIEASAGEWYRLEAVLLWDRLIARVYDATGDALLGEYEYVDADESDDDAPLADGDGHGWRLRVEEEGDYGAFDFLTKQPLSSAEGGSAGGGNVGDIDTGGYEEWDVLVTESDGSYEVIDSFGEGISATSDAEDALNDATDACPEGGVLVVKGHYVLDSGESWDISKDLTVRGYSATIESTSTNDKEFFINIEYKDRNVYEADEVIPGEDTSSYRPIIELDTSSHDIRRNHLVMIDSDERTDGHDPGNRGEGHMVAAAAEDETNGDFWDGLSSDEISLMETLEFDYDNSYDIDIYHYVPCTVVFEGFTLLGPDIWDPYIGGVNLTGVAECKLRDLWLEGISYEAVRVAMSYDCKIQDSVFTRGASNEDSGEGYGVAGKGGCAHTHVENCTFHMMRHGVAHGGSGYPGRTRRRTVVENCLFTFCRSTALDMHGDGDTGHQVINCSFHLGSDEAITFSRNSRVEGCYFNMGYGEDAIYYDGVYADDSLVVTDNYFRRCRRTIRIDSRDDSQFDTVNISDNTFEECERMTRIRLPVANLKITGNVSHDGDDAQIYMTSRNWLSGEPGIGTGVIANNSFYNCGGCIRVHDEGSGDGAQNINVTGNQATDCDAFIKTDEDCVDWAVLNNQMTGGDEFIDDSGVEGDWVVNGNVVRGADLGISSYDGDNFTY